MKILPIAAKWQKLRRKKFNGIGPRVPVTNGALQFTLTSLALKCQKVWNVFFKFENVYFAFQSDCTNDLFYRGPRHDVTKFLPVQDWFAHLPAVAVIVDVVVVAELDVDSALIVLAHVVVHHMNVSMLVGTKLFYFRYHITQPKNSM